MEKRPSWDEIFMFKAISSATRHTCLKRSVGAILVKDKRIIGSGYNGAAEGIKSCLELGYCYYERLADNEVKENKGSFSNVRERFKIYCQAVHSEVNAVNQCSKDKAKGSTLYITNYPCPGCTQDVIITKGIQAVRIWKEYLTNYALTMDEKKASQHKLLEKGISVDYVHMTKERIMEITAFMANQVGERLSYKYKRQK